MITHSIVKQAPPTTTTTYTGGSYMAERKVKTEDAFKEYLETVPFKQGDVLVRIGQEVVSYAPITVVARIKRKFSLSIGSRYSDGHPEVMEVCSLIRYDPKAKPEHMSVVTYNEAYTPFRKLTQAEHDKWIANNDHLQDYIKAIATKHPE